MVKHTPTPAHQPGPVRHPITRMDVSTIVIDWPDKASVEKGKRRKAELEADGWTLMVERPGVWRTTLTYKKIRSVSALGDTRERREPESAVALAKAIGDAIATAI